MIPELRRLVWRYQVGYFLKEAVRDEFDETVEELDQQYRSILRTQAGSTFNSYFNTSADFDASIRSITLAVRRYDFKKALCELEAARLTLERASAFAGAINELNDARSAIENLTNEIGSGSRLLDECHAILAPADEFLRKGKFRTVLFLAQYCKSTVQSFFATCTDVESSESAKTTLAQQQSLVALLLRYWPSSDELSLVQRTLHLTTGLLEKKQIALATRLLEETDRILEVPTAFLAAQGVQFGSESVASSDSQGVSWGLSEETNRVLQERLGFLAQRIARTSLTTPINPKAKAMMA